MSAEAAFTVEAAKAGAPLGVLVIARRMSLMGDALSHGILPGAAIAYLLMGPNPVALTAGALLAGLLLAALSSLLARSGRLPEDAAFAVFYLSALALGVLILGGEHDVEALHGLLFGAPGGLDASALILSATAATATLLGLALFLRGILAESADPVFTRALGIRGGVFHLLLMGLIALNLVAGFRAFGALMTVGLMMLPAAAARFWSRTFGGQAAAAVLISAASSATGLLLAARFGLEPGAVMILTAAALFAVSGLIGRAGGLLHNLPGRAHLEA
jgi:zinc/manganese transport system permease protein